MAGDGGGGTEDATTVPETGAPAEGGGGTEAGGREGGTTGDGGGATFTAVYAVLMASCLPCHAPGGNGATGGMLDMSSQASAYTNLVGKSAAGAACAANGGTRVVAGNAMMSLLYNKVSVATPRCGARMPRAPAAPLPMGDIALIRSWINAGALNN